MVNLSLALQWLQQLQSREKWHHTVVGNKSTNVSKETAAYPEKGGSTGAYKASYPWGQDLYIYKTPY